MTTFKVKLIRSEKGQVSVLTTLLLPILIIFIGGTCQWDETHPVKKLLYNIRAWLIFNLAHTPNHCLIVR